MELATRLFVRFLVMCLAATLVVIGIVAFSSVPGEQGFDSMASMLIGVLMIAGGGIIAFAAFFLRWEKFKQVLKALLSGI